MILFVSLKPIFKNRNQIYYFGGGELIELLKIILKHNKIKINIERDSWEV